MANTEDNKRLVRRFYEEVVNTGNVDKISEFVSANCIEMPQQFSAKVYKLGINPCVDVPKRISDAFGKRDCVPVRGNLQDEPFVATLVPTGGGRHRLYLNTEMRKRAGVEVGDRVTITLSIDHQPREYLMPKALAVALKKNKRAGSAFKRLSPSRQREILRYLNWVKHPETLQRNVEKVIAILGRRAGGKSGRAPRTLRATASSKRRAEPPSRRHTCGEPDCSVASRGYETAGGGVSTLYRIHTFLAFRTF